MSETKMTIYNCSLRIYSLGVAMVEVPYPVQCLLVHHMNAL